MIVLIPLDLVQDNPWQTRKGEPAPEYVKELAMDIARNGLMQHPVGRLLIDGQPVDPQPYISGVGAFYAPAGVVQLAFGHNRRAAYSWLHDLRNHSNIPGDFSCLPVDLRILTDEQMADYAWSENEKRRDHTPYERALAVQRRQVDFGWTQAQVADHLGVSRSAVTNMLRLLKLPENVITALAEGKISERIAMALVSLFDLPEAIRQKGDKGYSEYRPEGIARSALAGELTSDRIRERINELCSREGRRLDDAIWPIDDVMIVENVQSPVCKTCPSRFAERNLCLDPDCFGQKTRHAKAMYLEVASETCGIPPLEGDKSNNGVTVFEWWTSRSYKFPAIQAAGCENLRLVYAPISKSSHPRDVEAPDRVKGHTNAQIVCSKREQFCTCLKGLEYAGSQTEAEKTAPATAEDLKELARAARAEKKAVNQDAKDILREAAERIATGLTQRNHKTWRKLAEDVTYEARDMDDRDLWAIQMMIATHIAQKGMPYEIKTYDEVLSKMNKLLDECGLMPIMLLPDQATVPTSEHQQPAGRTLMEIFESEQEL